MAYEVVGYHGTDSMQSGSILAENFRVSDGEDEWLGYGVYFFTDGLGCPIENAIEWARNQAWSGKGKKYDNYAVIKATAHCANLLDLRLTEGLCAFNRVRDKILEKHDALFVRNRRFRSDNRVMWNMVAQMMCLDAIIHNLYIKNRTERIRRVQSNVPNTTVMCVKKPSSIAVETIKVLSTGAV